MLVQRMIRAATLDVALYEEVEHDRRLTQQAALVVVIVTVLSTIGAVVLHFDPLYMATSLLANLLGWLAFAFLSYFIGTKVFGGQADMGEMLRVLGFASTPMCLGIVPWVGVYVGGAWTIATVVVAIRQGLDISTGKAVVTAILSMVAYLLIAQLLGRILPLP